jgi:hypothetical protein
VVLHQWSLSKTPSYLACGRGHALVHLCTTMPCGLVWASSLCSGLRLSGSVACFMTQGSGVFGAMFSCFTLRRLRH